MWNWKVKTFSKETLNVFSESSEPPAFWILRKLYELCESFLNMNGVKLQVSSFVIDCYLKIA